MFQFLKELTETGGESFKRLCWVVTFDACESVKIC